MAVLTRLTLLRTLLPIDFYVDMSRSGENYRARAGYDEFEMAEHEDGQKLTERQIWCHALGAMTEEYTQSHLSP
jgi:hypothetical protein